MDIKADSDIEQLDEFDEVPICEMAAMGCDRPATHRVDWHGCNRELVCAYHAQVLLRWVDIFVCRLCKGRFGGKVYPPAMTVYPL